MTRTRIVLLGLVVVAGAICAPACRRHDGAAVGPTAAAGSGRTNLLVVTFDTTRADHLGPYGAKFAFTPTLNNLAARSFKFMQAFSSVPLTLPSHSTIMTGQFPFYHGVRTNSHFILKPEALTLAEVLSQAGYQTTAVVAAFVLDRRFGLSQGFATYDDEVRPASEFATFDVPERNAAAVTDRAAELLGKTGAEKPYFMWVHYYDPHSMYAAPDSFTRYQGHPYDVEIAYADSELSRLIKAVDARDAAQGQQTIIVFAGDHGEALGDYREQTHSYFAYDSTLHVPLMIRLPNKVGAGKSSEVVVSLADIFPTVLDYLGVPGPGEAAIHGRTLRPVIETGEAPASLTDRPIALEAMEAHYSYGWAALQGVRVGKIKYIDLPRPELYDFSKDPREGESHSVFAQRQDLAGQMQAAYHELFDRKLSSPSLAAEPQAPDADIAAKLQELGYVAGAPAVRSERNTRDLKDTLPIYLGITDAMSLSEAGDAAEASKRLIKLAGEDPGNDRVLLLLAEMAASTPWVADDIAPVLSGSLERGEVRPELVPALWVSLGRVAIEEGRNDEALKSFDYAWRAKPEHIAAGIWSALTLLRLDRRPEALDAMERAIKLYKDPPFTAYSDLGLIAYAAGQNARGQEAWSKCLIASAGRLPLAEVAEVLPRDENLAGLLVPTFTPLLGDEKLPKEQRALLGYVTANLEAVRGRHDAAIALLQDVQKLIGDDATVLVALAREYRQLGRADETRRLVEKSQQLAPHRADVVTALAGIRSEDGKIDDAVTLLEGLHAEQPANPDVANNLAWALAKQGKDLDRALKLARDALRKRSASATVQDTLGEVHFARKDYVAAARSFSFAARVDPRNPDYPFHLAEALKAAGRADEARAAYNKAVELAPSPRPAWYDDAIKGAAESKP